MSDELKCFCVHCGGPMEFPSELEGEKIVCPHCGVLTVLGKDRPQLPPTIPPVTPQTVYVREPKKYGCGGCLAAIVLSAVVVLIIYSNASKDNDASPPPAPAAHNENTPAITAQTTSHLRAQRIKAVLCQNTGWIPKDPWRIYAGETNFAAGDGWKQFSGKVVEVQPIGIRVEGIYGEPGDVKYDSDNYGYNDFFVQGFPYLVAEGDIVGRGTIHTAFEDGTYTYSTVMGSSRTIHRLKYGTICEAPLPSKEEVAAQAAAILAAQTAKSNAVLKSKLDRDAHTLKWNQDQAEQGDPSGLLRMGQRYATGDGVEKDISKARIYLSRAASLGNEMAQEELNKLDAPLPSTAP